VLVLVLALVVAPRPVLAIVPRLVLVAVLVLDRLRAVGDEVFWLAALEACLVFLLMFTRFSCSLSNRLVRSTSSFSPSTLNSSSGIDIKEDKENILVDGLVLAFPFEPPTRERLWESVGPSSLAVMQLSTSTNLSFENSSFTVRVSYFSDSTMASKFPPHIVRFKECKSLAALS
jgi:hypothetical protein